MNILFLEDSSISSFGGGQKISLEISEILSNDNHLWYADFTENSIYENLLYERFGKKSDIILKRRGKSTNKLITKFTIPLIVAQNLWKLLKFIKIYKIDCLYSTTRLTIIYCFLINLLTGIPYIHHAHLVNNLKGIYSKFWNIISKRAVKIICVSKCVLSKQLTSNSILIYNPCKNKNGFKGKKKDMPSIVAVAGSLTKIKGFEYFIQAAKLLPEIEFRIYGKGENEVHLKAIASSNVKFMGFVQDIISEMYQSIDIMVVPTIIEEAMSLVIAEAKSVGIPVIATNIGGQAELIQNNSNGILVPIKDACAIASAIKMLSNNLERYNSMAVSAYESARSFDYEIFVSKILSVFKLLSSNFDVPDRNE